MQRLTRQKTAVDLGVCVVACVLSSAAYALAPHTLTSAEVSVVAPQASAPQATPPAPVLTESERSDMLASRDPKKILGAFRTIYVKSTPQPWMTHEMLENALQAQPEFNAWGLVLVRDRRLADLSMDVRVPAFTFDYHYTVMHQNTSIVVLAGKTHAATGLDGATNVAKSFMKDVKSAGRPLPVPPDGKVPQKEGN